MPQVTKKILLLTDSPFLTTGYATISKKILNGLAAAGFECHVICDTYAGQDQPPGNKVVGEEPFNFWIHGRAREPYCKDVLQHHLKTIKPDVFGILLDTFMLYPWITEQDLSPARTFFYFPSDGARGIPRYCDQILRKMSVPVAMSKFGQRQVKAYYNIDAEYIPHACDTKHYRPFTESERSEAKRRSGLQNKFVIGCVARNQPRKMMDRTLKAFRLFAQGKDDVMLLLHMDPFDAAATFNIVASIAEYGLQHKVMFTGIKWYQTFPYERMPEVYNVMDVFFMLTSGEGFGIPTLEAAACGVPQVVTDITTTKELLVEDGQCGLPVRLVDVAESAYAQENLVAQDLELGAGTITGNWDVERGIASIVHGAECLQKLYDNPELRRKLGEAGVKKARALYDWDVVLPRWIDLMKRLTEAC